MELGYNVSYNFPQKRQTQERLLFIAKRYVVHIVLINEVYKLVARLQQPRSCDGTNMHAREQQPFRYFPKKPDCRRTPTASIETPQKCLSPC